MHGVAAGRVDMPVGGGVGGDVPGKIRSVRVANEDVLVHCLATAQAERRPCALNLGGLILSLAENLNSTLVFVGNFDRVLPPLRLVSTNVDIFDISPRRGTNFFC